MLRPSRRLAAAALTLLLSGASGCGRKPESIQLALELNDRSFCPGGRLAGKADAETVMVNLSVRTRTPGVRKLQKEPVTLKLYRQDAPLEILDRRVVHLDGSFGEAWRRLDEVASFAPPGLPGDYVLEASLDGDSWTSTELGVWYDPGACPDPAAPGASPPPLEASPPATATGSDPTREGPGEALGLSLEAVWTCDQEGGVDDLEVSVVLENPASSGRSFLHPGPRIRGVDELEPLVRTAGKLVEGRLVPGDSVTFSAHGWIETGLRPVTMDVPSAPGALLEGSLQVHCRDSQGGRARLNRAPAP